MAFDLFGLKKGLPVEEPLAPAPKAAGAPLSPKAWVLLAALDGALVLACAGVIAWRAQALKPALPPPAPAKAAAKPKPEPQPAKEAPKEEPKPEAKKPEAAKAEPAKPEAKKPEPKKPEPAKTEDTKAVPLGRPSVLATPPAARSAAPKGAKAAPAKPTTRPVPFSHSAPDAKEVYLAGPFLVRSGGRKMMFKDSKGVWTTTVYLNTGQNYRYRFEVVDAKGGKKLTAAQSVEVLPAD